ncbi:MAG: pectin acetylesterase-family hydrolase, partial [archaeon]|nr:pectin acetylesterase-family hydrolase [archaeon]
LVPLTDNATLGISGAVCNDGTQAAFYWRQGTTRQYIVHLQGGYWCWDEPSCMDRALQSPELTSSSSYAPQPPSYIGSGGFLNPDPSRNPVWASANLAYVMYEMQQQTCSLFASSFF